MKKKNFFFSTDFAEIHRVYKIFDERLIEIYSSYLLFGIFISND